MNKDSSSYFESDEFKEILSKYEEAKENNLTVYFDSDQLTSISDYYSSILSSRQAREVIEYALRIHPDNTDVLVTKAHLLIEDNKESQARELAESIQDASDYEVKLLKAELYILEGEIAGAEQIFAGITEENSADKDYYIDAAYLYLDNGHAQEALRWFTRAQEVFSGDLEIMQGLAESYFEDGQSVKAIEYYNKLLDENPYSADYWIDLGKVYFTTEEFNKAIEAYEFVLAIEEENRHATLMIGHCYAKLDNCEKAEEFYQKYSREAEDSDNAHYYMGICYTSMGKYQKAIDSFLKGIEADGEYMFQLIDIYSYLSGCYTELGNKERAMHYIDLAIKEDTECADTYLNKAKALLKLDQTEEALEMFHDIMERFPYDISTIIDTGLIFSEHRKYDWALRVFGKLEKVYPLAYHIFMIYIYTAMGETEKSREHLTCASQLSTDEFKENLNQITGEDDLTQLKNILLDMLGSSNMPES